VIRFSEFELEFVFLLRFYAVSGLLAACVRCFEVYDFKFLGRQEGVRACVRACVCASILCTFGIAGELSFSSRSTLPEKLLVSSNFPPLFPPPASVFPPLFGALDVDGAGLLDEEAAAFAFCDVLSPSPLFHPALAPAPAPPLPNDDA
jgi:hypothetical protein